MRQSRGLTITGMRMWVHGWPFEAGGKTYIMLRDEDYTCEFGRRVCKKFGRDFNVVSGFVEVVPESVGQFTGLKDAYHKDRVSALGYSDWIIEWHNNGWMLQQEGTLNYQPIPEHFVIIDNTTEHPELMEAKG